MTNQRLVFADTHFSIFVMKYRNKYYLSLSLSNCISLFFVWLRSIHNQESLEEETTELEYDLDFILAESFSLRFLSRER